jgi:hypothetical protein
MLAFFTTDFNVFQQKTGGVSEIPRVINLYYFAGKCRLGIRKRENAREKERTRKEKGKREKERVKGI